MDYRKHPTESVEDYIIRICNLKPELDMTWNEIADILNFELGENLSERTYRRRYRDSFEKSSPQMDINELKKERMKLRDELSQINNLVRLQAREEQMKETAIECAKEAAKIKQLKEVRKVSTENKQTKHGLLAIGDWHYGVEFEVFYNTYNPDVCRKRVTELANRVIDIMTKEDITSLSIVNLGDMISGRIHLPLRVNSRCDAVTQTMDVSEILSEFLSLLSSFSTIDYYSVSDNHSRVEPNKKESLQTEAFSRIIDWYLEERLKSNPNTSFHQNDFGDDIATFDIFDHHVAAVHGDKDKSGKIITNLNMFTQKHLDLILTAHLHHFSADENNETLKLCNGSLIGCDDYASGLRLNSKPSQLFIVSTPKEVASCIYKMDID